MNIEELKKREDFLINLLKYSKMVYSGFKNEFVFPLVLDKVSLIERLYYCDLKCKIVHIDDKRIFGDILKDTNNYDRYFNFKINLINFIKKISIVDEKGKHMVLYPRVNDLNFSFSFKKDFILIKIFICIKDSLD
jgi:hypothetical protein